MRNKSLGLGKLWLPILLSFSLVGCFGGAGSTIKPEAEVVVKNKYITCDIPDDDFITHPYPTRDWDWSTKKESDVITFITDHRDIIIEQNEQLNKAKEVYTHCKEEAAKAGVE